MNLGNDNGNNIYNGIDDIIDNGKGNGKKLSNQNMAI